MAEPVSASATPIDCSCGHSSYWHSNRGTGDCEYNAACECQAFADAPTEATADERLETMRLYVAASQPEPSKALLDWMREVEQQLAALRTVALQNAVAGRG